MGSNNTSVKVTTLSAGLATTAIFLVGFFNPELSKAIPLGYESMLAGSIAVVIGWITPNPND